MRPAGASFLFVALVAALPAAAQFAIPQPRCLSVAEARDRIASEKLAQPFPLMRDQAAEQKAEAIGVRLCDGKAGLVYEIDLLRKDGRLIHSVLDAVTGKPVAAARQ